MVFSRLGGFGVLEKNDVRVSPLQRHMHDAYRLAILQLVSAARLHVLETNVARAELSRISMQRR
jgi:hypothetical protein